MGTGDAILCQLFRDSKGRPDQVYFLWSGGYVSTCIRHSLRCLKNERALDWIKDIDIRYKERDAKGREALNLAVMVRKMVPLSKLSQQDVVPPEIEGVVTDVREVGRRNYGL